MSRRGPQGRKVDGIVLLDKPVGYTSNAALQRVKRLFGARKAGHTGSLDPLATGMLPICLGQATKLSGHLLESSKTYRVRAALGAATDTGDADGAVITHAPVPALEIGMLHDVMARFEGEIEQVPPMYSALKRRGQPLYKLARKGIAVERDVRRVVVHALELERFEGAELECRVHCSKGTYIRTLVEDIAAELGTVGHVTALRRLAVAPFDERAMVTLEQLCADAEQGYEALDARLLASDTALPEWPAIALEADQARRLVHGQPLAAPGWPQGRVRIYGPERRFLGVGEIADSGTLVSRRIFVT